MILFIWKLLQNFLPTSQELNRRHLEVENKCCICWNLHEDINHVFFHCQFSSQIWHQYDIGIRDLIQRLLPHTTIWQPLFYYGLQHNILEQILYILWRIWMNKNRCFHDILCSTPAKIIMKAETMLADYQSVIFRSTPIPTSSSLPNRWQPPPEGCLKLNTNASFISGLGYASLAFVLTDELGLVLLCGVMVMEHISSSLADEILALKFGLEQTHEFCTAKLFVESDSLVAI